MNINELSPSMQSCSTVKPFNSVARDSTLSARSLSTVFPSAKRITCTAYGFLMCVALCTKAKTTF